MGKLLNKKEAEEMIDALFEEYGLDKPVLAWEGSPSGYNSGWRIYAVLTKYFTLFGWTFSYKTTGSSSWCSGANLEELLIALERRMTELTYRTEKADELRQRHASRLLDEELIKEA